MRSNRSRSSRFHDSPSSSFFLCYTGVISPCAAGRLFYNFENIFKHNWAEISQQEDRIISLWGKFALRRIRQVMQPYPLPPIHPDPSYHIPVTQPTTPHSCSTANRHAMSAPLSSVSWNLKISPRMKNSVCALDCFWKMRTRTALRILGFHVQAVTILLIVVSHPISDFVTLAIFTSVLW